MISLKKQTTNYMMLEYTSAVFFFLVFLFLLLPSGTEVRVERCQWGCFTMKMGLLPTRKSHFPHLSPTDKLGCKSLLPEPTCPITSLVLIIILKQEGQLVLHQSIIIHEGQYSSVPNNGLRLLKRQTPASIKPQSAGQDRNNQSLYFFICFKHFIHSSLFSIIFFGI